MTNPIKPTVGRIVYFVMPDGQIRPAIIVRVWSDEMVQLQVFTDGSNDGAENAGGIVWKTSVHFNQPPDATSPVASGTWHWMPFQLATAPK